MIGTCAYCQTPNVEVQRSSKPVSSGLACEVCIAIDADCTHAPAGPVVLTLLSALAWCTNRILRALEGIAGRPV